MKLKQSLQRALKHARKVSENLLADFKTPEEWTHQVHPGANHALWFAGHMGWVDNMFVGIVDPSKRRNVSGWSDKFGMGSTPTARASDYPNVEEVLDYMRDRRTVLLDTLERLTDEDLGRATPAGTPRFLPDIAACFEGAVWHEGLHAGQISVARRALGNQPLQRG